MKRGDRLRAIFDLLATMEKCSNGLMAYKQLTDTINDFEDEALGVHTWSPPRTFLDGARSERLYTIYPESFFACGDDSQVTMLISLREIIFINSNGAIQVQEKLLQGHPDSCLKYADREKYVIFNKEGIDGGVWT